MELTSDLPGGTSRGLVREGAGHDTPDRWLEMKSRRISVFCLFLLLMASLLALAPAPVAADAPPSPVPMDDARPECNFTWLVADGTNNFGSTAMRIHDDELNIFIEAFPGTGTSWDPSTVTDADIIIQEAHGHFTHYDPATVAMVQKNTGAIVVGNSQVKNDMLARGVPASKIVELSPSLGGTDSATDVAGCNITAIGMSHTMATGTQVDTYFVEMPSGIKWFHGTCAASENYATRIKNRALLDDLDMMAMDFEHNRNTIWTEKSPNVYIETHTFAVGGVGYLWDEDPATSGAQTLFHNTTYNYKTPLPNVPPVLGQGSASPRDVTEDDTVNFRVFYSDVNDDAPSWAKVWIRDSQGGTTEHAMSVPPGGSPWTTGRFLTYSTKLSPDIYDFRFDAFDGEFQATGDLAWKLDNITVRPRNKIPELSSNDFSPKEGDTTTTFRFDIMYRDMDDQSPTVAKIFINDVGYDMTTDSGGPFTDWVYYYYDTTMPVGDNHRFYYSFTDGKDSVRVPKSTDSPNWIPGPVVELPNLPPTLTAPLYSPQSGYRDTEFTFSVVYTDAENDHPTLSYIYIDEAPHMMSPGTFDYVTGSKHTYRTKLDIGFHEYYFKFSDGEHDVRLPVAGVLEGPEVLNRLPEAVIGDPDEGSRFAPEEFIPFRAGDSTDEDGDDLTFTWTSDKDGEIGTGDSIDVRLSEGTHVISLLVEDAFGGSDVASVAILVKPYLPEPVVEGIEANIDRPVEGDTVRFTVRVGNYGEARATGLDVILMVDDMEVSRDPVSLDIDEVRSMTFSWVSTTGEHTITAKAGDSAFDISVQVAANTLPDSVPYIVEGAKFRPNKEIYFKANASDEEGDGLTYLWDFGDTQTSTQENPSHIFAKAGTYTVTLTITDARGGTTVETITVEIIKPKEKDSPGFGALLGVFALLISLIAFRSVGKGRW
jgi:hypothetical protein